jgi:hypothetical protein
MLGHLRYRSPIRLAQDLDHLLFAESTLLHGSRVESLSASLPIVCRAIASALRVDLQVLSCPDPHAGIAKKFVFGLSEPKSQVMNLPSVHTTEVS